jgi:hypothetical protein
MRQGCSLLFSVDLEFLPSARRNARRRNIRNPNR